MSCASSWTQPPSDLGNASSRCDLKACLTLLVVSEPHLKELFVEHTQCEDGQAALQAWSPPHSQWTEHLLRKEPAGGTGV